GMALGVITGPRVLKQFSRRRMFGLTLVLAGIALFFAGAVWDMVLSAVLALVFGFFSGMAGVSALRLLGEATSETARAHRDGEEDRARALALLHWSARVPPLVAGVSAPVCAGLVVYHLLPVGEQLSYQLQGSGVVLVGVGLLALIIALVCHSVVNRNDPEAG